MDATAEAALDYLRRHHVMTLATAGPDGPWAAAVFYASDGFRLWFLSRPGTRHGRAIEADPRVAATIQDQPEDWRTIRGIQLEGTARRLRGGGAAAAMARYLRRFHGISADPALAAALAAIAIYELRPTRVYLVDNRVGFGHRAEVPLETSSGPG